METSPDVLKRSIESLLKLQEIDGQLFQIQQEERTPPADFVDIQNRLNIAQNNLKSAERTFRDADRERRGLELRLLTLQEDLKRSESKRKDVRNTKEEFAAGKEYDNFHKKVADTKKALEEKTTLSQQKAQIKDDKQKVVSDIEAEFKIKNDARSSRLAEIKVASSDLVSKRNEYISQVDESIFSLYERVQKIRKGSGIALVKNLICSGCFVSIPPQLAHQLDRLSAVITCPSCSRILFPASELGNSGTPALSKVS